MPHSPVEATKIALLCAATFVLAACGGGASDANEATVTAVDSNVMLEQLGNDASALEAAANAAPIAPANAMSEADSTVANSASTGDSGEPPVLGETRGGDTGGNIVQDNATGQ